ncbi:alpha/beta hydrolase family protein [Nonomuraea typhae]|uniref:alpha/beta hydrolase family protein n=1 Tax=Nonomuraea typhae TaxID=2603600 RepID=UPI0012FB08BD|nr:alpha/beta fold hydrolase [Nonomuraea typhae]
MRPDISRKELILDGRLHGTLTTPPGEGPHPAALILMPGKLDRDGNLGKGRIDLGPALATALAERGVAAYRYDRRGVGATPGDWMATGFHEHRQDAATALRELAKLPGIGPVGAIGYSEGALHAAALGAREGAAAVVMISGHAKTGEETLLWWAAGKDAEGLSWPLKLVALLLGRSTMRGLAAKMAAKLKATKGDVARLYGVRLGARSMREFLVYDPKKDLSEVRVPLLALTGAKDVQVDPADLETIADVVPGPAETRRVPDLTHLLRRDPGPATQRTYGRQYGEPVDAGLVEEVAAWTAQRLGAGSPAGGSR